MEEIQGFILAGGMSRRMGTDKSRLQLGDLTFIDIIAAALQPVTGSISLVGGAPHEKFATIPDVFPEWGALGGLHAALKACTSRWAFVVACDLPFVTEELITSLLSRREDYDTVIPIQADGRPQPLCAGYRIDPCRATAETLIHDGKRRPLDLLDTVNTRWVPFAELNEMDQAELFFVNINTPEDYYEATRKGLR